MRKEYNFTNAKPVSEIPALARLVVSHTERGGTIRIISARVATNKERQRYET